MTNNSFANSCSHPMSKNSDRKRKYGFNNSRAIEGPGIWASYVKGRDRQAAGELLELFDSLAAEIWPIESLDSDDGGNNDQEGMSIEDQIANELAAMKKPKKKNQQRFVTCATNTECVVFISCRPPVDPVKLVVTHVNNVAKIGINQTRYIHRLIPVSGTCVVNIPEIHSLCKRVFTSFFITADDWEKKYRYKIDLRVRNHDTLTRQTLLQEIALCVPEGHTVDLEDPELFILAEVFKNICGISVVKDYYRLEKFNVIELAKKVNGGVSNAASTDRVISKVESGRVEQ